MTIESCQGSSCRGLFPSVRLQSDVALSAQDRGLSGVAIKNWSQIIMLAIYAKAVQEDLTPDQKKALKKIVEKW